MTIVSIGTEAEMLAALRARKQELNVSFETIEAIAGLPSGYASKLLCDPPMKRMGALSLGLILAALGYTIHLVEDAEAFALIKNRLLPRKRPGRGPGRKPGQRPNRLRRLPWLIDPKRARHLLNFECAR